MSDVRMMMSTTEPDVEAQSATGSIIAGILIGVYHNTKEQGLQTGPQNWTTFKVTAVAISSTDKLATVATFVDTSTSALHSTTGSIIAGILIGVYHNTKEQGLQTGPQNWTTFKVTAVAISSTDKHDVIVSSASTNPSIPYSTDSKTNFDGTEAGFVASSTTTKYSILHGTTALPCQTGWSGYKNHCYLFVRNKVNWFQADKECKQHGANLASVTNVDENNFIARLLTGPGGGLAVFER
uniref:C-type lectin domain-containing protein n=1 Tax=Branchiostoma floridae TaxID=7739 RepID=C3ZVH4_BRAFL|eukprot:XP_002587484.1 hypothetical protein BRAFLDRAFT_100171 [Branchiostoma floridae]